MRFVIDGAAHLAHTNKKFKWNFSESDSENEIITEIYCNESPEKKKKQQLFKLNCLLSWLKKQSLAKQTLEQRKKNRSGNLFVEEDNKKHAANVIKTKAFNTSKCKIYSHDILTVQKE